jgi:hypothetical protein
VRKADSPALAAAALIIAITVVVGVSVDFGRAGGIKGDEATYVGMAASLAFDGDLEFRAEDYRRFRQWYGRGPEGIFLKQSNDGSIHFGKAFVYGIFAAPFARAGLNGLFAFNIACLAITIAVGVWWLRPQSRRGPAVAYSAMFAVAAVTALYSAWLTSDIMNYALVFLAFALAWPRDGNEGRPGHAIGAAILLGAAIFSKPLNALLALPLALGAKRTLRQQAVIVAACVAATVGLFAVNAATSGGDPNYQGGNRKTFYTHFPFDEDGHDFNTAGITRATDALVTLPAQAEGRFEVLPQNLWYFLTGQHFGLLPFGWPWLLSGLLWVFGSRGRTLPQWALVATVGATVIGTILWMPYTWSGGGGPIGNRYFLSTAAVLFFLTPAIRTWAPAVIAAAGLIFMAPSLSQPFTVAQQPWLATQAPPFRLLPIEMTGASDFPAILDQRRGRIPQGRNPTLFVALLDRSSDLGRNGWIAVPEPARAQMLVRAPSYVEFVTLGVKTTDPCDLQISAARRLSLSLGAHDRKDVRLAVRPTFSHEAFAFVIEVDTSACAGPVEIAMQAQVSEPPQTM